LTQSPATDPNIDEILLTEEQIGEAIARLGEQISSDYASRDLLAVGVLKGAFVIMADLARAVTVPIEFDFMAVSSYGMASKTSGVVRILKDLDADIAGRDILLVEGIIDSGLTLGYLMRNLAARGPSSVEVCALMQKKGTQRVPTKVRYCGFEIPDVFVVGYGTDYGQRYRNLPYVATLKQ
jgi:hypoxanthine phosphoribosyltransferase